MAYTQVDGRTRSTRTSSAGPALRFYGRTSQFNLNAAAMEALQDMNGGAPVDRIELLHDEDTNNLAFRPAASDNPSSVDLKTESKTAGARSFGFRGLARSLDFNPDSRWILPMELYKGKEGTFLFVELNKRREVPINTGNARKHRSGDESVEDTSESEATEGEGSPAAQAA